MGLWGLSLMEGVHVGMCALRTPPGSYSAWAQRSARKLWSHHTKESMHEV